MQPSQDLSVRRGTYVSVFHASLIKENIQTNLSKASLSLSLSISLNCDMALIEYDGDKGGGLDAAEDAESGGHGALVGG